MKFSYFSGTNKGIDDWLHGYQIGLKFPILFSGNSSRIKASKLSWKMAEQDLLDYRIALENKRETLSLELSKYQKMLDYFDEEGKVLSTEIFNTAKVSFENGEINFFQYLQSIENALEIMLEYMDTLNDYNQAAVQLKYITL